MIIISGNANTYQEVIEELQEKEIEHTYEKLYHAYEPTLLQFQVNAEGDFELKIPYKHQLKPIEAKYAIICKYNSNKEIWEEIDFENNKEDKAFIIKENESGIYGVFKNRYWYSTFTQELANEYPRWTRVRQSKESVGQQFLNFFGIELEELEDWLNWILDQKFISTADIHVLDWIYMYQIEDVKQNDEIKIFNQENGRTEIVPVVDRLQDFFFNDSNQGGIIDFDENKFYSKIKYENLRGVIRRDGKIKEFEAKPIPFHVWNIFDEFGLLLGVKRLYLEDNVSFKERLLDVFRYPANTSKKGLLNGIARELNLIKRDAIWRDDFKEFVIKNNSGLPIKNIKVDYQELDEEQYEIIDEQHVKIFPLEQGKEHIVSFIYGLETHELHDKKDEKLHLLMFQDNGQATDKLINWVSYINTIAPIMWDHFKWDEAFWDTISKDLSGLGYIPNMWDTDISIWKNYKFFVDRWEDQFIWQ